MYGTRERVRPRRKGMQNPQEDLRMMDVIRWWEKVMDRDYWRRITKEFTPHHGLIFQERRRIKGEIKSRRLARF